MGTKYSLQAGQRVLFLLYGRFFGFSLRTVETHCTDEGEIWQRELTIGQLVAEIPLLGY